MPLLEAEAPRDPILLFDRWFREATQAGALQPEAMTLATGKRLGRHEIRSKIGEGGMGEVYLAQDVKARSYCGDKSAAFRSGKQSESNAPVCSRGAHGVPRCHTQTSRTSTRLKRSMD